MNLSLPTPRPLTPNHNHTDGTRIKYSNDSNVNFAIGFLVEAGDLVYDRFLSKTPVASPHVHIHADWKRLLVNSSGYDFVLSPGELLYVPPHWVLEVGWTVCRLI